eukprot:26519-Eustigmatos_ZCMA.PRE.1
MTGYRGVLVRHRELELITFANLCSMSKQSALGTTHMVRHITGQRKPAWLQGQADLHMRRPLDIHAETRAEWRLQVVRCVRKRDH